jgi:hypothetical protein
MRAQDSNVHCPGTIRSELTAQVQKVHLAEAVTLGRKLGNVKVTVPTQPARDS